MPNTINVTHGSGAGSGIVLQKWFTARTIHATGTSRSYNSYDIGVGDIVTLDPYSNTSGHEGMGIGSCVAIPTSGFEKYPAYVVTAIHPDVNRGVDPGAAIDTTGQAGTTGPLSGSLAAVNPRAGGWVDVCPLGVVDAYIKGSAIVVGDVLAVTVVAPSSGLVATRAFLAEAASTAYNDATLDTLAEQLNVYGIHKAMALEADSSNAVILKRVAWGGLGGNQAL